MQRRLLITACAFLVSTSGAGLPEAPGEGECWRDASGQPPIKVYRGPEELLSGESFAAIVRLVDQLRSSDREDTALQIVMREMSMRDEEEAKPLLAMLLSVADRLPRESARVHFEAQCDRDGNPRATGLDYAPVHSRLYSLNDEMLVRLLQSVKAKLDANSADLLEMWVQANSANISVSRPDFEEHARTNPERYAREYDKSYLREQCLSLMSLMQ